MTNAQIDVEQLLAGTRTHLPASVTMHVDGEELTKAQVIARLQGYLEVYEKVAAARAAYGTALDEQNAMAAKAHAFKVSYASALRHVLGKASPALEGFAISVQQRRIPSPEIQVLAHAKRLATRKARGTLGKRQKQRVKGAPVTAVTLTGDGAAKVFGPSSAALPAASPPASAPKTPGSLDG